MDLKRIVEKTDTAAGLAFDFVVQSLIIISLLSFAIETLPDLDIRWRLLLHALEVAIVAAFTVEYVVRLAVADRRTGFAFSFYGIVDLIAILPFYIASGVDLRSVRVLRLLRLFRAFKLLRYSQAIQRFNQAFRIAREEIVLFFFVSVLLLYVSAVGIYYFEHSTQPEAFASVFHSLWWAVVTLTTVGYGDIYPLTVGGRVFTFAVLMIGLGVVAVPAGLVASALSEARRLQNADASASVE